MRHGKNLKIWVGVCASLLAMACPASGRTITVDDDGLADFNNIQAAINDANDGDTVEVKTGIYTGEGNRDIDFLGKAITLRSIDPNDPCVVAATIIDCNGTGANRHRGFIFHSGEDDDSILAGFTVSNGYGPIDKGPLGKYPVGGGIYCSYSSPTIDNCIIKANEAVFGGGILNMYSNPLVKNCTFGGNLAIFLGAGMCNHNSSPTVTNCIFTDNQADPAGGELTAGGGIMNDSSNPTVANCTFSRNYSSWGGGMFNFRGNPIVTNCTFSDNSAYFDGGGIANDSSNPTVANCTFSGNSATGGRGGGMLIYSSNLSLRNCTFSGNSAYRGGGIYNTVSNTTLANSILWDDTTDEIFVERGTVLTIYSDVQGGWPGQGNIDADPCFVDANNGDYHLLPDSPCIDEGDNNSVPPDVADLDGDGNTVEPIPFDLEGNPRIFDGNGDGNSVVDMGAYEYFVPPIQVSMKFTPQALNPSSKGNWIKAHFVLPEGYAVGDVDANRPAVVEPGGIESDYMNVFVNNDGLVEIEAAFGRAEFCSIVTGAEPMEVTVVGSLTSGQQFYGTDTIKITTNYLKYLGTLASRWLEAGCSQPDWCSGLDLDQDSAVDFVDYALFDGCCVEVVKE